MVPGMVPSRNRNLTVSSNSRINIMRSYKPNRNARSRNDISTYFNSRYNRARSYFFAGVYMNGCQQPVCDALDFLHGLVGFDFEHHLTTLDRLTHLRDPARDA